MPSTSPQKRFADGKAGTGPGGGIRSIGSRSSSPTWWCLSMERRSRQCRDGDRRPRSFRPDGLLGRAVRDDRLGRSIPRSRRPRPTLFTCLAFTSRPATHASRAAAEAAANAHQATELETEPDTNPASPEYTKCVEALGEVYCGNLDRYVELTASVGALPGQAAGIAAYVDGLQSAGRVEETRTHWCGRGRGPPRRESVLDRVHTMDRRVGVFESRREACSSSIGRKASKWSGNTTSISSRATSPAMQRWSIRRVAMSIRPRAFHLRYSRFPSCKQRGTTRHHPRQRPGSVRTSG